MVLTTPRFDQNLNLLQRAEYLAVQGNARQKIPFPGSAEGDRFCAPATTQRREQSERPLRGCCSARGFNVRRALKLLRSSNEAAPHLLHYEDRKHCPRRARLRVIVWLRLGFSQTR